MKSQAKVFQTKEQDKSPETNTNEIENHDLWRLTKHSN